MSVLRAAMREFGSLVGVLVLGAGFDEVNPDALPRRGASWVAVQTAAAAFVIAALLIALALPDVSADWLWMYPVDGFGILMLVFSAGFLALPLALHWYAAPPWRVVGLTAGLATAAVVAAPGLMIPGTAFGIGFALVAVGFVAGGAVFGAVSAKPASSRSDEAAVHCS